MARGSQGALAAPSSTGRPSGGYGVGPYFLAKFLVDTPVDSLFAMLFAAIVGPMAGLNSRSRCAPDAMHPILSERCSKNSAFLDAGRAAPHHARLLPCSTVFPGLSSTLSSETAHIRLACTYEEPGRAHLAFLTAWSCLSGGPDRTRWSTHSGSSRRIMVLTVRMGTEGQQWERYIYARLPPREGVCLGWRA
jgi:hypothetical protein